MNPLPGKRSRECHIRHPPPIMKLCNCLPNFPLCLKNDQERILLNLPLALFHRPLMRPGLTTDQRQQEDNRFTRQNTLRIPA